MAIMLARPSPLVFAVALLLFLPAAAAEAPTPHGILTADLIAADLIGTSPGAITALAGDSVGTQQGDGLPADGTGSAARFALATNVIVYNDTVAFVTDKSMIRRVNQATGEVATLKTAQFGLLSGIAADRTRGCVFVADTENHVILRIGVDSGAVEVTFGSKGSAGNADGDGAAGAKFNKPKGLAADGNTLLVCDSGNHAVRKINLATNAITTLAGGFQSPTSVAVDFGRGVALVSDENSERSLIAQEFSRVIYQISLSTGNASTFAILRRLRSGFHPVWIAIHAGQGLVFISTGRDGIHRIAMGNTTTIATLPSDSRLGALAIDPAHDALLVISQPGAGYAIMAHTWCAAGAAPRALPRQFKPPCNLASYTGSCPDSFLRPAAHSAVCTACPSGMFQENTLKMHCKSCPAGKLRNASAPASSPESEACAACPVAQYQAAGNAASLQCTKCAAGKRGKMLADWRGYYPAAAAAALAAAGRGESSSCHDCPAGQFSHDQGQEQCTACSTRSFQDLPGETGCKQCDPSKFRDADIAPSSAEPRACTSCPAGRTQNVSLGTVCQRHGPADAFLTAEDLARTATIAAVFACALCWMGVSCRRAKRRREERDGTRDAALLKSYVPPKDLDPGCKDVQLQLFEIEVQLGYASEQGIGDPAGELAACFVTVKKLLDKVVTNAYEPQLRAVVRLAGMEHKAAYLACHSILEMDVGYKQLLVVAAAAAESRSSHPHQTVGDIYDLQVQAREVLPEFQERMRGVVAAFSAQKAKGDKPAVKLHFSPPKHLYRCLEKMCLKPGAGRFTATGVCDVVRCIIECDTCTLMSAVLQALLACRGISIARVKDRANNMTSMNWMDVMVNLLLVGDSHQHVCEVQIVHSKMLLARSGLGGHGPCECEPQSGSGAVNQALCLLTPPPQPPPPLPSARALPTTPPQMASSALPTKSSRYGVRRGSSPRR